MLSANMKVKVVKENLMHTFQERFEVLFFDPEFGFKADDKLVTQIIASLCYEFVHECDPNESCKSIITHDVVSTSIYFVYDGNIEMHFKDQEIPLLEFENGSYFGDISYIFQVKN